MGNSDAVKEVEDQLPGMRLSVQESSRGKCVGRIVLACTITDDEMWPRVVEKLDGLKLFGTFDGEVMDALSTAIDMRDDELKISKKELKIALKNNAELAKEVQRLTGILAKLGVDLGLE
jgi:hypothetical protein